jgi:hypothetical protein
MDAGAKKDTAEGITIESQGSDELVFTSKEPVSIAYETLTASWVAKNLGREGEPDIILTKKTVPAPAITGIALQDFGLQPKAGGVLFVPLVSEKYLGLYPASIPFAEPSARAIGQVFTDCGAEVLVQTTDPLTTPLTSSGIDKILDHVRQKLSSRQYSSVIFYYVGHAYTAKADSILLILGDYDEKAAPKGIYALADLYKKIETFHVPFSLLIDGCFTNEGFDELKQALHLTANLDYMSPDDNAYEAISRYAEAQANFPRHSLATQNFPELKDIDAVVRFMEFDYLLTGNPVLFAAKPGELAYPRSNPASLTGNRMAPLAWKASRMLEVDISDLRPVSLGAFLESMVDFRGSGEISARGTCSWSNFDSLQAIPFISN